MNNYEKPFLVSGRNTLIHKNKKLDLVVVNDDDLVEQLRGAARHVLVAQGDGVEGAAVDRQAARRAGCGKG